MRPAERAPRTETKDGGRAEVEEPAPSPAAVLGASLRSIDKGAGPGASAFEAHLIEQVQAALTVSDLEGRITHWNRQAEVLFGWSAEEAVGRDYRDLLIDPANREAASAIRERVLSGHAWEGELPLARKAGPPLLSYTTLSPIRDEAGGVSGVASVSVDLTERVHQERLLAARTAVTHVLAEATDLADATPRIMAAVCDNLEWDIGALWRVDEPSDRLRCVDVWHEPGKGASAFEQTTRETTFPPGVGLPGRVWLSGEPAWISDVVTDPNFPRAPKADESGLHSAFGFPILLGGTALGVLEFFSRDVRQPDDLLIQTMSLIGSQIGQFMRRLAAQESLRESSERLRLALQAGKLGTWRWDLATGAVTWDETLEAIFGLPPGSFKGTYDEYLALLHPEDRAWVADTVRRSVDTESGHQFEHRVVWPDGSLHWVEGHGHVVRDEHGTVVGMVGVSADVTRRKLEVESQRFLAQAGALLSSSLDYEETLKRVARLAVSSVGGLPLADWCAVHIRDEDGQVRTLAVEHIDPTKAQLAESLNRTYPQDPNARTGVPEVIRSGRCEIYPDITDEMLIAAARDDAHLAALRSVGMRSALIAPMSVGGRAVGAITFVSAEAGRRYGEQDVVFVEELARRAGLAVENSRLYQATKEEARKLQEGLLPPELPQIPNVELAARYRWGRGSEIGGDFYDAFPTGDRAWALVIGDVCGKGAEAAVVTGLARHTIRAVALRETTPSRVLLALNEAVRQQRSDRTFCTVTYVRLRPSEARARLTVCCAGHPLPIVLRANGAIERAGMPGTLLGIFQDPELTDHEVDLRAGDALVLFTDGVTEERAPGAVFGVERLMSVVASVRGQSAAAIADAIEHAVRSFRPEHVRDDMAVLVMRVRP